MKQQIAEEQMVMVKHRVFCKALPKTLDSLDRPLEHLDRNLRHTVIDKNVRTMITSRCNQVIGQVKLDMMAIDARQTSIIKRAQYVTNCKVSFFDETPTLLIE